MKFTRTIAVVLLWASCAVGFSLNGRSHAAGTPETRKDFMTKVSIVLGGAVIVAPTQAAHARGRATLEQAYERYSPRIIAGGLYYKKDLRALVEKNDWAGIKRALAEPPKKSKEDRAKIDGGVAERASQAGGFSDARVLVACDLYAAAFSDNSFSPKTKKMRAQVEELRTIAADMQQIARQGLGEESGSGGLFGIGAKKPSQSELAKNMREKYVLGGNAYNKYIFEANSELSLEFKKLPFL